MKGRFVITLVLLFAFNTLYSQETKNGLVWYTDAMKANELSKSSGKPIFAFFTGSDWCGWCHKLENDVYSKQAFKDWAKKNVILLELDFPRKKQLSQELSNQNMGLQQALGVRGYPTIWLMYMDKDKTTGNVNLNTLGSLGYPRNAVPGKEEDKFLEEANSILKSGTNANKTH